MLPTLLIAMDLTVLHLAMPSLNADFQPSSSQLLCITGTYGFMIAGSLITMGAAAFGLASVQAVVTG